MSQPVEISPEDAATLLGVHPRTIRNLIKRQQVRATKVSGRWYVDKASVEAAISAALAAGQTVCEIVVPFSQAEDLRAWVEANGMRCACVIERPKKATLVVSMYLAPPQPEPVGGE
jgi:excisionase family DNA binding protein